MPITQIDVLAVLKASKKPLRNAEIRRAILGTERAHEDADGQRTGEVLQKLKSRGLADLVHGSRWGLAGVIECPACGGHGHLLRSEAAMKARLERLLWTTPSSVESLGLLEVLS